MGSIYDLSSRRPSSEALKHARSMAENSQVNIYDTPAIHLLFASKRQVVADKVPPKNASIYDCSFKR